MFMNRKKFFLNKIFFISLVIIVLSIKPVYSNNSLISDAMQACEANNLEKFEKIIKPLANKNNPEAQYILGIENLKTSYCGNTVQPNYKEALNLLKKAALQKHIQASLRLSDLYDKNGSGRGKIRSDSLQSMKWVLLAFYFNNEFANVEPSGDFNTEKYQNDFRIQKQFLQNKNFINARGSQAKKNMTKEQYSLVKTHVKECLQDLSKCNDTIVSASETGSNQTASSNNSQGLICKITLNEAIPCTGEKIAELEKKGAKKEDILKNPFRCGKKATIEFVDLVLNKDSNTMSVNNVGVKFCRGAPENGKEAAFRQECNPIEQDFLSKDGFLEGKLIMRGANDQVAKLETSRKKQLIQNLDSNMATRIIKAPSEIAYSYGPCYAADKKESLVKEHKKIMKQKELDNSAEKKEQATKDKYKDAPKCESLYMKNGKYNRGIHMNVMSRNPPEPCYAKVGSMGKELLLPKSMR